MRPAAHPQHRRVWGLGRPFGHDARDHQALRLQGGQRLAQPGFLAHQHRQGLALGGGGGAFGRVHHMGVAGVFEQALFEQTVQSGGQAVGPHGGRGEGVPGQGLGGHHRHHCARVPRQPRGAGHLRWTVGPVRVCAQVHILGGGTFGVQG